MDDAVPRLVEDGGWHALSREDRLHAVCEVLRDAIRRKKPVLVACTGMPMIFCPQVLARQGSAPYVLGVVLLAEAALVLEELRSPKRWRWIKVADLDWAMVKAGQFQSIPNGRRPVLHGLEVELEISVRAPRKKKRAA